MFLWTSSGERVGRRVFNGAVAGTPRLEGAGGDHGGAGGGASRLRPKAVRWNCARGARSASYPQILPKTHLLQGDLRLRQGGTAVEPEDLRSSGAARAERISPGVRIAAARSAGSEDRRPARLLSSTADRQDAAAAARAARQAIGAIRRMARTGPMGSPSLASIHRGGPGVRSRVH